MIIKKETIIEVLHDMTVESCLSWSRGLLLLTTLNSRSDYILKRLAGFKFTDVDEKGELAPLLIYHALVDQYYAQDIRWFTNGVDVLKDWPDNVRVRIRSTQMVKDYGVDIDLQCIAHI